MALVSIIVPTFNRVHFLPRAVDSALAQSHGDVEVLVVDDGSSDNTQEVVRDLYNKDSRVRYIFQKNQGVSAARNAGLRAARGEFLALLDSDDVWKPWKLEIQLACLEQAPHLGMVWSDMEAIDPSGRVTHERYLRAMYSCWRHYPTPDAIFAEVRPLAPIVPRRAEELGDAKFYSGEIFSHMIRGNLIHTSTVLLRRDRAERVGFFNEALRPAGEDFDFHLRTTHAGPVGLLDVVTIQYQLGLEDRITRPEHGLAFAMSFLRTIEPYISEHGADIHLPKAAVRAVLAEAHQWIAEEQFSRRNLPEARRHLWQSLNYSVAQSRAWALLVASCLPAGWTTH